MSSSKNLENKKTSFLTKTNSAFIEQMYLKFIKKDPALPSSWKDYFQNLDEDLNSVVKEINGPTWDVNKIKINIDKFENELKKSTSARSSEVSLNHEDIEKSKIDSIKAIALIRAYRIRGHLIANLDPLGMMERSYLHELHPKGQGFKKEDYNKKIFLHSYLDKGYASINELIVFLKKIYCSSIGVEYMHISDPVEKVWFRERMEKEENQIKFTNVGKKRILNKLIQAEGFEKFLALKFIGTKRFGLDGAESLIPALEQIIKRGGQLGIKEVKIGMPHRGRLNVLANLLQKSYKKIFNEFAGEIENSRSDSAGDVKYHLGASSNR